jgi:hypothetical protein
MYLKETELKGVERTRQIQDKDQCWNLEKNEYWILGLEFFDPLSVYCFLKRAVVYKID